MIMDMEVQFMGLSEADYYQENTIEKENKKI